MAAATTPPILTNITSNQLECTLHCTDYHCLLRLRSGGAKSSCTASSSSSSPDISSIVVIPIDTAAADQELIIHLLPKLLHNENILSEEQDGIKGCQHHPCHELIRISHNLQVQLKERLQDASDGAITTNNNTNNNNKTNQSNGMMEDFLLQSEAVFHELLSAVKQQSRREETSRYHGNSNERQNGTKKRARISTSTSSSATTPSSSSTTAMPPPLEYYHALLLQLRTLQNMPNVTDVTLHKENNSNTNKDTTTTAATTDLTRVSITCQDNKKRSHTWHAELYPTIVLTVDLPAEFVLEDIITVQGGVNSSKPTDKKWWVNTTTAMDHSNNDYNINDSSSSLQQQQLLPRIQQHFEQTIHNYQSLFDELDDLDSNLWILEPTLPARRSCVERRIALWEGGASVVIVLDHEKPRGVPIMVRFLGVTMAAIKAVGGGGNGSGGVATSGGSVADWRASFAEFVAEEEEEETSAGEKRRQVTDDSSSDKKKRWSEERSIRDNLELWLGSSLPSPLSTEKSDYLVECGICYSHRLPVMNEEGDTTTDEEGPLPEEKCSNSNCNRYYHESCLFEWLHSLPTARVSFDRIFGNCPYCCEGVSVKVLNRAQH